MSSPSSSVVSHDKRFKYDVFIGFRGEDTRRNFTDHLHAALYRSGIFPFRDDEELQRGEAISEQLINAIKGSRCAIVVISPNYASSSWCLDELENILECKKAFGQVVLPIFYNVQPSDVRRQKGGFKASFKKFKERRVDSAKVKKWREALTEVGNLSGWDSTNRHEASLIECIVHDVHTKLGLRFSGIPSELVGIEERVHIVEETLEISSDGSRSVGIVGMGGSGKTTIARVVYERMLHLFNAGSFLADIRELSKKGGIVSLQKQLLSQAGASKNIATPYNAYDGVCLIRSQLQYLKVLVVLDDVDDIYQVEHLAGDLCWFGPGSRIIMTTRDKRLLDKVDDTYEVKLLDDNEALTLFRNHAFGGDQPENQDYEILSSAFCRHCGGLPLALKLIGSSLAGRSFMEWVGEMGNLARTPKREILDVLRITYDGLDDATKKVFLYTACILRGYAEIHVEEILSCLGFFPDISLRILRDKSLVNISNNCVLVHELLYELCKNIVHKDSIIDPGKQQMLLSTCFMGGNLDENSGSEATEGLKVASVEGQEHPTLCCLPAISRLTKLRLLLVRGDIMYVGDLESLSSEMRYLRWESCPLESLPESFQPQDICSMAFPSSSIRTLWDCNQIFEQLKWLVLRDSKNLLRIPDLSNLPHLHLLDLEDCTNLIEVRSSRPLHESLSLIVLTGCTSLVCLPKAIEFPLLVDFRLSGCYSLEIFPEISGRMENFKYLNLDETAISELPPSICQLVGLKKLTAHACCKLKKLPSTFVDLESLETLDLSRCSSLNELPENFWRLNRLTQLNLTGCGVVESPSSMTQLRRVLSPELFHHHSTGSSLS